MSGKEQLMVVENPESEDKFNIIGTPPKYLDKMKNCFVQTRSKLDSCYKLCSEEEGGGVPVQMSVLIHRNISGGRVVDLDGPPKNIGVMVGQTQ